MVSSTTQLSYVEKLKDPQWQKKRLKIMERDNWQCQRCGREDQTLNVHHRVYEPAKEPWGVEDDHLVTLCDWCHKHEKDWKDSLETLEFAVRMRLWDLETFDLACSIGLMKPDPMPQDERRQFLLLIDFLAKTPEAREDVIAFVCRHSKPFAQKIRGLQPYTSYPATRRGDGR